jgi:hypothetical protein
MRTLTLPAALWRPLLAHGLWLLIPAVVFGATLAALLRVSPAAAPAAVVGAILGLVASLRLPSRRGRLRQNQQIWAQMEPAERERWQRVYEQRSLAKIAIVFGPTLVLTLALAGFGLAHSGAAPATPGEYAAALVAAGLCCGTAAWALQWVAVAYAAAQERAT